jgi:FkbM family methyltransferase
LAAQADGLPPRRFEEPMSHPSVPSTPLPLWKKVLLRFLQAFIVLGALTLVAALVLRSYPYVFVWGLAVAGRAPTCSAGDVFWGAQKRAALDEAKKRIGEAVRVTEEDTDGYELWESPEGGYWLPRGSGGSFPVIVAQQAVDIYGVDEDQVQPGDIVLDCGAHIGTYARKALQAGAKLVVAIEPAPANVECLRRNLQEEIAAGRVILYPKGVWDQDDVLPLYEDPDNSAADSFVAGGENAVVAHTIPLIPIDKLVEELGLDRVDVIKMDIKGASYRALKGARETLRKDKPRLAIATEEAEDDIVELRKLIDSMGLGYRSSCGTCSLAEGFVVDPEVAFFQ